MDSPLLITITKYALHNAVKYNGKANAGAVIGKIFAENPELKANARELGKEAAKVIKEINKLSLEEQEQRLGEFESDFPDKEKKSAERDLFDFFEIREGEKVITAFPPEPSKYPHLGHAKSIILNYELARRYNGTFYLRFEDTNPEAAELDYYAANLRDYEWLGIKPDKIDYASDFMEEFYKIAEKIISDNHAYVCSCSRDIIKENRRNGIECACRYKQAEKNLEEWKAMFRAKAGKYVLRVKGNMTSPNSTLRDAVIFRIIDEPHPRKKKKYRVWPNYDFESAVMDGIEGITHRIRSKEFELRNDLQSLIQTLAGFKPTKIYEFARFNLKGIESSGRIIREKVKKKELIGWDDPSITTLSALRRRGFLPGAIKNFVLSTGITKNESEITWNDLYVHNRRLLDPNCDRYFFVEKPKKISIQNAPKQKLELKLHPEFREKGTRAFDTAGDFYITQKDFSELKNAKFYRLMDCLNFTGKNLKFFFDSIEYDKYKEKGDKIIHWLPVQKNLMKAEVLMPDKKIKKGLAEPMVKELKAGDVVQFARFGFCRLDEKKKDRLKFWFTHE